MEVVLKQKNLFIIRFDRGEEIIDGLRFFCQKKKIKSGFFTAIGACEDLIVSYYNLLSKKYKDKRFKKQLEIASVTGNIAWLNKTVIVHAHGLFSDEKMRAIGGHVKKLVISGTGEVVLITLPPTRLMRRYSPETGLNLLSKN